MKTDKVALNFRIDEDLHTKIKFIAEEEDRSLNSQIEYAVRQYIYIFERKNGNIILPKKQ